ncbi:MAG TPA: hypothetical protein VGB48_02775 [Allosphingosinicella sp.]|jgi:hypothetical protein
MANSDWCRSAGPSGHRSFYDRAFFLRLAEPAFELLSIYLEAYHLRTAVLFTPKSGRQNGAVGGEGSGQREAAQGLVMVPRDGIEPPTPAFQVRALELGNVMEWSSTLIKQRLSRFVGPREH